MQKTFVLVVDDERALGSFAEAVLVEEGYETDWVSNGAEALEALGKRIPDAILLDLMMPVMDGFEVVRRVRSDPQWELIPIFILSGKDDLESIARGLELGADEYLLKPFSPWEFTLRLGAMLRRIEFRRRRATDYPTNLERVEQIYQAAATLANELKNFLEPKNRNTKVEPVAVSGTGPVTLPQSPVKMH